MSTQAASSAAYANVCYNIATWKQNYFAFTQSFATRAEAFRDFIRDRQSSASQALLKKLPRLHPLLNFVQFKSLFMFLETVQQRNNTAVVAPQNDSMPVSIVIVEQDNSNGSNSGDFPNTTTVMLPNMLSMLKQFIITLVPFLKIFFEALPGRSDLLGVVDTILQDKKLVSLAIAFEARIGCEMRHCVSIMYSIFQDQIILFKVSYVSCRKCQCVTHESFF